MANISSMFNKVANSLGLNMLQGKDSGLKEAANKNPLADVLGGENLVITEASPMKKLGEIINEKIVEMLNNAPANARGLMAVLKATAEANMAIAENLKPNEELQKEIKEKLEELKKLEERLQEDDQNYQEVLARFKEIFIDVQTENILDKRRAEEHPIQA
ncbi:MAG: hypothetical protein MJ109_02200 [Kiritimatiellae bacterium]|nr:hypothetical protein [Kiritimatiellia bacterium]